jgi:hypothetical protein
MSPQCLRKLYTWFFQIVSHKIYLYLQITLKALKKILKKDPLYLADDDHPDRKDISKEEFDEALQAIKKKFGLKPKKDRGKKSPFSATVIEALNSLKSGKE